MNQDTGKIRYNLDLLKFVIQRDCAILIGEYPKLNKDTVITFICSCKLSDQYHKSFRRMYNDGGAFCRQCTLKNTTEKLKAGNLEKYGVENQFQRTEIKEKMKETNLEKYGVEHPLQNKELLLKTQQTNLEKYGNVCTLRNTEILSKTRETNISKFGVIHPTQNKEVYEKIKKTNLDKYGVENVSQSNSIKQKRINTNLHRYGFKVSSKNEHVKEKMKNTCLQKYGGNSPFSSILVKNKSKDTCKNNHGVEYPMQSNIIQQKQQKHSYMFKKYILPSGNIVYVQGYEHFALDILLKTYVEDQIKIMRSEVPRIKYLQDNTEHYYFPDIYISHEKRIIEVKSTYIYNKELEKNLLKKEASIKAGFKFEFWIISPKGTLTEII